MIVTSTVPGSPTEVITGAVTLNWSVCSRQSNKSHIRGCSTSDPATRQIVRWPDWNSRPDRNGDCSLNIRRRDRGCCGTGEGDSGNRAVAMIDKRSCSNAQVGACWPVNPGNRCEGGTLDGTTIVLGSDSSSSFHESAVPRKVDSFPQKPREDTAKQEAKDSTT